MLGGSWLIDLAGAGEAIWHLDGFSPALVCSGVEKHNQMLDWGEKPFNQHTTGVAYDGEDLWVLDNEHHRICAIEKRGAQRVRWIPSRAIGRSGPS